MEFTKNWSDLLTEAVTRPGLILDAYTAFHGYSIGNQIAAMVQCAMRDLAPSPISTYHGWQKLNRQVKKGEKAIWLCMPLTRKKKSDEVNNDEIFISGFIWKPHWFVLSQTEGEPYAMPELPVWSKDKALSTLNITETKFSKLDGNVMGYASKREIAISPLSPLPHKTLFHEMAHVELGHTAEADFTDSEQTPRSLREVEAEAVALLLCESLSLAGSDYCRGYVQNWLGGDIIPEKSSQKIFSVANKILIAGREQ
jgi:hypothetical protein